MITLLAILAAMVAACCFAASVALQHGAVQAANSGPTLRAGTLGRLIRSPRWLGGTMLGIVGASLHATALSIAPLVIVQPIGVLSLVVTVLIGRTRTSWGALLAVCLGVTGFVVVAAAAGTDNSTTLQPASVQPFVVLAIAIFALGTTIRTRARCLTLAAAAAVLFGTGSALIKAASQDIFVTGHLMSGFGIAAESVLLIVAGGWVVHQAYAAGPAATVIAVTTVTDPLTAVVIGFWAYGEAAHLGTAAVTWLACLAALAAAGVIVLARRLPEPVIVKEEHDMPRILIAADTFPPDVNGAAHFAARLARGLAARGHDVHVVCPSSTGRPSTESDGVLTVHRIKSLRTPFHPTFRYCTPWRAAREIGPLIDRLRPDIAHSQSHFSVGRSVVQAAAGRGLPVIATNHFMPENLLGFAPIPRGLRDRLAAWAWRDLVRVYRQADVVTSPTQRAVDLLTAQGFPGEPLAISCGVDLDHYAAHHEPARDHPSVLFVGRLDKEKNVDDLLRALPLVLGLRAEIVGEGSCRADLEKLAARLGIAERVRFHGLVSDEDLVRAYRRCDMFCMPGTAELQSIATMEAMAASLPVVAADAMALPHLVRAGYSGFLYPPGRFDLLAATLACLADDPARRVAMGRAGQEMIAAHGLDRTLDTFEELYSRTAGVRFAAAVEAVPAGSRGL